MVTSVMVESKVVCIWHLAVAFDPDDSSCPSALVKLRPWMPLATQEGLDFYFSCHVCDMHLDAIGVSDVRPGAPYSSTLEFVVWFVSMWSLDVKAECCYLSCPNTFITP